MARTISSDLKVLSFINMEISLPLKSQKSFQHYERGDNSALVHGQQESGLDGSG